MSETEAAFAERTSKTIFENFTITLHGRIWIQVHSQIVAFRYNTELSKQLLDVFDINEC